MPVQVGNNTYLMDMLSKISLRELPESAERLHSPIQQKTHISGQLSSILHRQASENAKALLATRLGDVGTDNGNGIEVNSDVPTLPQPRRFPNAVQRQLLLQGVQDVLGDVSIEKLNQRLAMVRSQRENKSQEGGELAEEIDSDSDVLENLINNAKSSESDIKQLSLSIKEKQHRLEQLQHKLSGLDKDSPEFSLTQTEVVAATQEVKRAQDSADQLNIKHKDLLQGAKDKLIAIENKLESLSRLAVYLPDGMKVQVERQLNALATMTLLIAEFSKLIGESDAEALANDMKLMSAIRESNQARMLKEAAEYEEQVRKQEEMQKTMGCIGKIIGALVVAISCVAAVFTGGAALIGAGVGMALMAGDMISEATTGKTLTGMILDPFMEHVFMPLMDLMKKGIDLIFDKTPFGLLVKLLEDVTGVKFSDTVKTLMATVAAVAAMVAIAAVLKSAGQQIMSKLGPVLSKVIGKALIEGMQKTAPALLKAAGQAKQIGAKMSQKLSLNMDPNKAALYSVRLQQLGVGAAVANSTTQGVMTIEIGKITERSQDMLAELIKSLGINDLLNELSRSSLERFSQSAKMANALMETASSSLYEQAATTRSVTRNISV